MSPLRRSWILVLLALALLQRSTDAKNSTGLLRLGGPKHSWKYMDKFGYDIGSGKYQVRLQLHQPKRMVESVKLQLEVYLDEQWEVAEQNEKECERKSHSKRAKDILLLKDGQWSAPIDGVLTQKIRPHMWYFAISDCNLTLKNYTHRIRYEFRAVQADGSHFSVELKSMRMLNVLCFVAFTVFCGSYFQRCLQFFRSSGSVHPIIWTLTCSMGLQYVAQTFHTIHLLKYASDGMGVKPLEVMSEIFFMLSQVCQTSLLIIISLGYTLLQSKIGELDLVIPLFVLILLIHGMLVGFGKIHDGASYKFHENEGVVGWILLTMRLLLYAWFLWGVQSTAREGGMKLQSFLRTFRFAGSLYFLSYPLIFIIFSQFAPYLQHRLMSTGLMVMQMASNVWLTSLFLTRGDFFKVSTLNSSDLPGGVRVGMAKEE